MERIDEARNPSRRDPDGSPPPELGHEELDRQHRVLLRRWGHCQPAGNATDLRRLASELWFIERYALDHFASEERIMEQSGYSEATRHMRRHRQFAARMARLRQDIAAGSHQATNADFDWMSDWFEHHIREEDLRLRRHLEARRCAGVPAEERGRDPDR